MKRIKKFSLVLLLLVTGFFLYKETQVLFLYFIAFFTLYMLLTRYEQKGVTARRLVLLATLVGTTLFSRMLFFFLPGFSPMVSLVILSGLFLDKELGLMTGLLVPLVSNLIYGQGPWTPFQMLSIGLLGYLAGTKYVSKYLMGSRFFLILYGIFAGVFFSMMMDIWTVYSIDGFFSLKRYLMVLIPALPFTLTYSLANSLFLNIFFKTMQQKSQRIKKHYQID